MTILTLRHLSSPGHTSYSVPILFCYKREVIQGIGLWCSIVQFLACLTKRNFEKANGVFHHLENHQWLDRILVSSLGYSLDRWLDCIGIHSTCSETWLIINYRDSRPHSTKFIGAGYLKNGKFFESVKKDLTLIGIHM